jgi:acetyltransferase-like isoleucine patch superfamily enzyme
MKSLAVAASYVLPWFLRRRLLRFLFGYDLHPSARIGIALLSPRYLVMAADSYIGHLTVCKGVELLKLGCHAFIGRGNWITGHPIGRDNHFLHQTDRRCELLVDDHATITNRHLIDCTNRVQIGSFATVAGFHSQILTHSVDLALNRQSSSSVSIGCHSFVGTSCIILGGSALPERSVLGAHSLLNKCHEEALCLYAGSPAKVVKALDPDMKYFNRSVGFTV